MHCFPIYSFNFTYTFWRECERFFKNKNRWKKNKVDSLGKIESEYLERTSFCSLLYSCQQFDSFQWLRMCLYVFVQVSSKNLLSWKLHKPRLLPHSVKSVASMVSFTWITLSNTHTWHFLRSCLSFPLALTHTLLYARIYAQQSPISHEHLLSFIYCEYFPRKRKKTNAGLTSNIPKKWD